MKKILNIIIATIGVMSLFTACDTEHDNPVLDSNVTKPTITSNLPATVVIGFDNLENEYATITFNPAVYSTPVPVTNQVQLSLSNTFSDNNTIAVGAATSEKSITLTNKVLNSAIVSIGGVTLTPNTAWLRIKSAVTATTGSPETALLTSYSDPVQVTITPYEPQPAWVYAVGAFQGWNNSEAGLHSLVSMTDNGIYIGYINFPEVGSTFLILPTNTGSWDHKWGSDDADVTHLTKDLIKDGGGDIKAPVAGYLKVTVNLADADNGTITFAPYSWGIIGDATPGGWDADTDMTWNYENLRWECTIQLTAGEIKFRLNNDWSVNFGGTGGTLNTDNDNNIPITEAGTYFITMDEANLVYTIVKQ